MARPSEPTQAPPTAKLRADIRRAGPRLEFERKAARGFYGNCPHGPKCPILVTLGARRAA